MATILFDENIDGYADHLSRLLFSSTWNEVSQSLGVRLLTLDEAGLTKGIVDADIWEFCQRQGFYLLTDNRNKDSPESLEATIRSRTDETSLPVFTISDIARFRSERGYADAVAAKLLEYLMDAENTIGSGRLYLP